MAVRVGGADLANGGERALERVFVVYEDHAQPTPSLAVGKPVRLDSCLPKCGHDLVQDVGDAGREVVRRFVLEVCDLCSHVGDLFMAGTSGSIEGTLAWASVAE
jgi:hypothetical protein